MASAGRAASPPGLWRALREAIAATESTPRAWDDFVNLLRDRPHVGPAADDPFWLAIGLPAGPARGRLWLAEHRAVESVTRELRVRVWGLGGESYVIRAAAREKVRALRLTLAERHGCCVGQINLFLEVGLSEDGRRALDGELGIRIASHLGCSPIDIPTSAGGASHITLPVLDRLTLWHYGYLIGRPSPGRLSLVVCRCDADSFGARDS